MKNRVMLLIPMLLLCLDCVRAYQFRMLDDLTYIEQVLCDQERLCRSTILRQLEDCLTDHICQSPRYRVELQNIIECSLVQNLIPQTGVWLRAVSSQDLLMLLSSLVELLKELADKDQKAIPMILGVRGVLGHSLTATIPLRPLGVNTRELTISMVNRSLFLLGMGLNALDLPMDLSDVLWHLVFVT